MAYALPTFSTPIDGTVGTLAVAHAVGSQTLILTNPSRLASANPSPTSPVRLTVLAADGSAVLGQFMVTALAGSSATVAVDQGFGDATIPAGSIVGVTASRNYFLELETAILNVGSAVGSGSGVASVNGATGAVIVSASSLGLGPLATLTPTGTPSGSTYLRGDGQWAAIPSATPPVSSVAGRTGSIVLTTADVAGLAAVAKTGAYGDLTGKPTLAAVATSGSYLDLTNRPTSVTSVAGRTGSVVLSTADIGGLSTVATSGAYGDLSDKPTLGSIASHEASDYLTPTGDGSALTGLTGPQIAGNIAGRAGTVATIDGLMAEGSNVSISGAGTVASPYVISASGGGSGGSSGPTPQLKAVAVHGTPFLWAIGNDSSPDNGGAGNDDPTDGPAFFLTYNGTGNRQVALFPTGTIGSGTSPGFRFVLGFPNPVMDGVDRNGNPVNLLVGGVSSSVGVGFDATATQSDVQGQLHVRSGATGRAAHVCQAIPGQTADLYSVLDSVGSASGYAAIDAAGCLRQATTSGPPADSPAAGTTRFDPAANKLYIRGDAGWVSLQLS